MRDIKGKKRQLLLSLAIMLGVTFSVGVVLASSQSEFSVTINPGTLSADIVNSSSSHTTVASPAVALSAAGFSTACSSTTGTLGTATEAIYVSNPDAADGGWTASIAATSGATSFWDGAVADMDFNDPTTAGCADSADADALSGELTVNPSGGTVAVGECATCVTTNVSAGSSNAFEQGVTDSITLFSGAAGSDDIGDWTLTGVSLSQTIPANQSADTLTIDMTVSVVAD